MVMEAQPSPQCVGREFVRQYYTLLNQAPTHLHRFYNNQSSFVHGGLDPPNRETSPMIGQKQIHQKIQQLNFQDCHAKITQVDSQATLGNGVVVQVTGELSNAGQPMRRFTQTFVLAAQSPKKYYVHNDIFRYQDEIYTDDECEPDSARSEPEDEQLNNQTGIQGGQEVPPQQSLPQQGMPPTAYYSANSVVPPMQPAPNMSVPPHHGPHVPPAVLAASASVTVNGSVHPEEVLPPVIPPVSVTQVHLSSQGIQGSHNPLGLQPTIQNSVTQPLPVTPLVQPVVEEEQKILESQPEPEARTEDLWCDDKTGLDEPTIQEEIQVPQEPVVSNEPKTYATLVKSGGNSGSAFSSTSPNQNIKPSVTPPPAIRTDNRDHHNNPMGHRNNIGRGGRQGGNTGPRNLPRQDSRNNRSNYNDDNDDRRRSQQSNTGNRDVVNSSFHDTHQLFLGNLPHNATEEELRDLFSRFGNIVELRIHSKSGPKGVPGTRNPPNYGFITYEDHQGVQNCLAAKPLFFPPNSEAGQKLNVEEKKTRLRPTDGGRLNIGGGPDNQGMGGRPGNNMGARNSPMMRGGPGGMGHRGPPRGGANFQRGGGGGDNRGQNMNRGGGNSYGNRR